MATMTPFLSLRKPATTGGTSGLGDPADAVADISDNMDTIDTFASDTDDRITDSQLRFYAVQTVNQNSGSGGWVAANFTTEDKDTHNGHSTATNTSRYVASLAGSYELNGASVFDANTTGSRGVRFSKNGTVIASSDVLIPATPGGAVAISSRTIQVDLTVGDYVEMEFWNNSGSTLTVSSSTFGIKYLGP